MKRITQVKGLTAGWVVLSLGWSVIRSLGIRHVFGPHGTNAVAYLLVDVVCTVPFAIYSARAAFVWINDRIIDSRALVISVVAFFAPDLFVVATAKHVPLDVWIGFLVVVTALALVTVRNLVSRK